MPYIKSAKIFFFFAVLAFVAKPFIGFGMVNNVHPPAADNILVKIFSKRKLEYDENSKNNVLNVQKKLADPVQQFVVRFTFLLCLLFPVVFAEITGINNRFLRRLKLSLNLAQPVWLLTSKLLI
jgi:hypothetical protein